MLLRWNLKCDLETFQGTMGKLAKDCWSRCCQNRQRILNWSLVLLLLVAIILYRYKLIYFENNMILTEEEMAVPYPPKVGAKVDTRIPRIVHQTWKTEMIPRQFSSWMKSWHEVNPSWQQWFWTDADAHRLIKEKYPEFLSLFDNYAFDINRADVMRYFILYEYGGIYVDMDVQGLQPMDDILAQPCYLSQEPLEHAYFFWGMKALTCNAVMACRPRHPFFAQVLRDLKYHKGLSILPFVKLSMAVMQASGPIMVTRVYNKYNASTHDKQNKVSLWPAKFFFPSVDGKVMPYVHKKCLDQRLRSSLSRELKDVCNYHERTEFRNQPYPNPYANHHWVHTYYGVGSQGLVPVRTLLPSIKLAREVLDRDSSLWNDV